MPAGSLTPPPRGSRPVLRSARHPLLSGPTSVEEMMMTRLLRAWAACLGSLRALHWPTSPCGSRLGLAVRTAAALRNRRRYHSMKNDTNPKSPHNSNAQLAAEGMVRARCHATMHSLPSLQKCLLPEPHFPSATPCNQSHDPFTSGTHARLPRRSLFTHVFRNQAGGLIVLEDKQLRRLLRGRGKVASDRRRNTGPATSRLRGERLGARDATSSTSRIARAAALPASDQRSPQRPPL